MTLRSPRLSLFCRFGAVLLIAGGFLTPLLTETLARGPVQLPGSVFGYLPLLLKGYPPPPLPGRLLITEVLYHPLGTEPDEEWIELYNAGGLPVSLAGYKIGDEETRGGPEGMYQFPPGAQILAGQVIVVANRAAGFQERYGFWPDYELQQSIYAVPDLVKYTAWASGGMNLANTGDEVFVLDTQDTVVDALSWGASKVFLDPAIILALAGSSLERFPAYQDRDQAEDWRTRPAPQPGQVEAPPPTPTPTVSSTPLSTLETLTTPTHTAAPTQTPTIQPTPGAGRLLISEVLVDPFVLNPQREWFELYNAGGSALDISQYKVGDEEQKGGVEGMFGFPPGARLEPGEVILVAYKADEFYVANGLLPDYELVESRADVPNLLPYSAWASGLIVFANSSDELLVLDGQDQVIDALSWGSSTWAFNPPVPPPAVGSSLERCPAAQDSDQAADWRSQAFPSPGEVDCSPGR